MSLALSILQNRQSAKNYCAESDAHSDRETERGGGIKSGNKGEGNSRALNSDCFETSSSSTTTITPAAAAARSVYKF